MRRIVTALGLASLLLPCSWAGPPSGAVPDGWRTIADITIPADCTDGEVQAIACVATLGETTVENILDTVSRREVSPGSPPRRYRTVVIPKIWGASDGEVCVKMIEVTIPEDRPDPIGGVAPDRYGVCPDNLLGDPTRPQGPGSGPSTGPDTTRTYAVRYWQNIPLPRPEPRIAPGRAITGMFAYLETRGSTSHTYTEPDTPFGPLTIVATGRYFVDWGDGTTTGPHSAEGGPWPDGQITHEYINIGDYDVVVTERWTATWSFGSESGTLDELRTVGRINDFPVQQIQAVVLR